MANPLIKLLLKQIEDGSVMIERHIKSLEWMDMHYENKMRVFDAFDQFHSAVRIIKVLLEEAL